jgi:hypothetical protein
MAQSVVWTKEKTKSLIEMLEVLNYGIPQVHSTGIEQRKMLRLENLQNISKYPTWKLLESCITCERK